MQMSPHLKLLRVLQEHPQALETHFHYAACIKAIENEFDKVRISFESNLATELSYLVFDLEVMNGLALCDWELDGRPQVWYLWQQDYLADAFDLLKQFKQILNGERLHYIRHV